MLADGWTLGRHRVEMTFHPSTYRCLISDPHPPSNHQSVFERAKLQDLIQIRALHQLLEGSHRIGWLEPSATRARR